MLTRTLTQAALPGTVGARIANWLTGVLDAADTVAALPALTAQAGGAAGTHAAATELTGSPDAALGLCDAFASAVGLAVAPPWHTTRSTITRIGDAMVGCCDAWGHIANDVATGSRTEIGELAEGSARPFVDDAAQGQPGAVGADPARRADRARARRHAAHRVGGECRRTFGRRLARRMGHPAHAEPGAPSSRPARPPTCSTA